jgi:3',5'-cyclic AMP phosphodiesterase CpdA
MATLLTLLHISDLHIGDINRASGSLDAEHYEWWRQSAIWDGYLGHRHRALQDVVTTYRALRDADPYTHVVMTGDLTAMGARTQLEAGRRFLTERFEPERGRRVGLGIPDALDRCIPGNHDHWPGHPGILGPPTDEFDRTFPRTPWRRELEFEFDGRTLRVVLVGINSDAEVWCWGASRLLARGHCVDQLEQAATAFGKPATDEVRVLLLHHTRHASGYPTGLGRRSREVLERVVEEHDVAVVLTGHLHEPHARTFGPSVEICAGTTTQLDEPPIAWHVTDDEMRRFRDNTLCVHRLVESDTAVLWHVEFHRRIETGFVPASIPSIAPFVVWPRAL